MKKIKIEPKYAPFPKPIALIGSMVNGTPNFMPIAWFSRMSMDPNIWMISINKHHYTFQGIKENSAFSMNFPSPELVEQTDFCGLVSGREVDKSFLFKTFYGELKIAPMIIECPINVELELIEILERYEQKIVLASVKNIYTEKKYLSESELDPQKLNLMTFMKPNPEGLYYRVGQSIAQAWSVGKGLKEKE